MPRGVYIGLPPRGTIVIRLGAGPSRLSLRPPSFLPASGAHRLAGPADRLDTVAALLMTQARSSGHGNSVAVYRAITIAIPHLIWLMARGALGRSWPTPRSPTPTGPSSGRPGRLRPTHRQAAPPSSGCTGRHHGHSVWRTVAEVRAGMATVPRLAGDLPAIRLTVAMPALRKQGGTGTP